MTTLSYKLTRNNQSSLLGAPRYIRVSCRSSFFNSVCYCRYDAISCIPDNDPRGIVIRKKYRATRTSAGNNFRNAFNCLMLKSYMHEHEFPHRLTVMNEILEKGNIPFIISQIHYSTKGPLFKSADRKCKSHTSSTTTKHKLYRRLIYTACANRLTMVCARYIYYCFSST